MILDVLVFALGFMVAGLLALAALPAVWRRALRLSEERLSRLVPLSSEEIAAERDHLRAAHAVALRRVEQRLESSEADRAALRIAAARREAHISDLDDAAIHAQVGIAERDAAAAALREEVAGLWAGHGAEAQALDGLARLAERRLEEVAVLQAERDGLRQEVDRHRGAVAGLETRLIGAETRGGDLARDLETARREAAVAAARTVVEPEAAALRPPDAASRLPEQDRAQEVAALKAELAFMVEQARSAERRATESAKALETLKAEVPDGEAKTAADPAAAAPRDDATLRAAVAALADEVMRFEARRRR